MSVWVKYDISTFSLWQYLFNCTALHSPEHCSGRKMKFYCAEYLKHADELGYWPSKLIFMEYTFENRAVTGDETLCQSMWNKKTFQQLLLHLKMQRQPSNNTPTALETVAFYAFSWHAGVAYLFWKCRAKNKTVLLEQRPTGVHCILSMCTNKLYLSVWIQGIAVTEVGRSRTLGTGASFLSEGVPVQLAFMSCPCLQEIHGQCCRETLSQINDKKTRIQVA